MPLDTADMTCRRSGRSGLKLPELSLGLWQNFGHTRPLDASRAMVRRAFDLGITHFDLANNYGPPYGSAEDTLGKVRALGAIAARRGQPLAQMAIAWTSVTRG